jgi:hypothetical protein
LLLQTSAKYAAAGRGLRVCVAKSVAARPTRGAVPEDHEIVHQGPIEVARDGNALCDGVRQRPQVAAQELQAEDHPWLKTTGRPLPQSL